MENLLFLAGLLIFLVAIISLFKPNIALWWASTGKRTRFRTFAFWLLICLVCWSAGAALSPSNNSYMWILPGILCVCAILACIHMHKINPSLDEIARQKKADKERNKLAKQERQAEKKRERQAKIEVKRKEKERLRKEAENQREIDRLLNEQIRKSRESRNANYDLENEFDDGFDDSLVTIETKVTNSEIGYDNDWETEWRQYLRTTYGKKPNSTHDRKLRQLFGGDRQCLYNFSMYEARLRRGEILCVVPADDYYRQRFDMLATNGVAIKFSAFNPGLLQALSLPQMREVGRAAGLKSLRVDKAGSLKMLLDLPEETLANAWTAAGVELDSIFQLRKPEDIYAEVKIEN